MHDLDDIEIKGVGFLILLILCIGGLIGGGFLLYFGINNTMTNGFSVKTLFQLIFGVLLLAPLLGGIFGRRE